TDPLAGSGLSATRLHNRSADPPPVPASPVLLPWSIPPLLGLFLPAVADARGSTSGSTPFAWIPESAAPGTHQMTSGSRAASTVLPALHTDTCPVRRIGYPVRSHSSAPRPG